MQLNARLKNIHNIQESFAPMVRLSSQPSPVALLPMPYMHNRWKSSSEVPVSQTVARGCAQIQNRKDGLWAIKFYPLMLSTKIFSPVRRATLALPLHVMNWNFRGLVSMYSTPFRPGFSYIDHRSSFFQNIMERFLWPTKQTQTSLNQHELSISCPHSNS